MSVFLGKYTADEVACSTTGLRDGFWTSLAQGCRQAIVLRDEAVLVEFTESNCTTLIDDDPAYEENLYLVFTIRGQYFKKTGIYNSHSGASWSWYGSLKEVKPVTKTVTVYE